MRLFRSLLFLSLSLSVAGCFQKTEINFVKPLEGQLSLAGDVPAVIFVPGDYRDSLVITLDGVDVTDLFAGGSTAQLPSAAGEHELVASFSIMGIPVSATRNYETLNFTQPGAWTSTIVNAEGGLHKMSGVVTAIDPPNSVEFTWGWHDDKDQRGYESQVRLEVNPNGSDGTLFRLTHSELADEESARNHGRGWGSSLNKLERIAN